MTRIVEESEQTDDGEEDHDFETFMNKNLTINMPKHIR